MFCRSVAPTYYLNARCTYRTVFSQPPRKTKNVYLSRIEHNDKFDEFWPFSRNLVKFSFRPGKTHPVSLLKYLKKRVPKGHQENSNKCVFGKEEIDILQNKLIELILFTEVLRAQTCVEEKQNLPHRANLKTTGDRTRKDAMNPRAFG